MRVVVLQGPPGCGKSYALANVWIPKAAKKFSPAALVVCSLTKAAARVIAARTSSIHIPEEQVGTLHKLLFHAQGRPSLVAKEDLDVWNTEQSGAWRLSLSSAAAGDSLGGGAKADHPGDKLLQTVDLMRARRIPPADWGEWEQEFYRSWADFKKERGVIEFTDLVETALDEGLPCPGHPRVLFADEAQDHSALEMALILQWGEDCDYCVLAGDPNQEIFSFRGGDARLMMEMATEVYTLTQSYRCSAAVVDYSNELLACASKSYPVEYKPTRETGTVQRRTVRGNPVWYCEQLLEKADGGTAMYLAACGYLLPLSKLKAACVPFHNPYAPGNARMNPLGLLSGKGGAHRVRQLLSPRFPELRGASSDPSPWSWKEMHAWASMVGSSVLRRGAKTKIKERAGINDAGVADAKLSPADYASLFSTMGPLDARTPEDLVAWLGESLLPSKRAAMRYVIDMGSKDAASLYREPKLVVSTIHGVKGGEADVVALATDISSSAARLARTPEGEDALIRQFYVGATRARKHLEVLAPLTRNYARFM